MSAVRVVNSRFCLCTSLVPSPMIMAFDLGTRLHVRMRTKLESGVLLNGQPPQCCKLARVNLRRWVVGFVLKLTDSLSRFRVIVVLTSGLTKKKE